MQLKQRLNINIAASVTAALIVALMLSLAMYRVNRAMEASDIADELVGGAFERSTFGEDYLRTDSERARIQWYAKYEEIGGLLKAASEKFQDADDRKAIDGLINDHQTTGKLFTAIVEARGQSGPDAVSVALNQEAEDRLRTQMNVRLYEKILNLTKLHESARKKLFSALRLGGVGIIAAIVIIIAATLINSLTMGRVITDRIQRLRGGASVIGGGNLDYRIELGGDDEFAELADAFNAMTSKLKTTYHDLEAEVEERQRAQEALGKAYDELELRVQERTKDLKDAEASLREINDTLEQRVAERTAQLKAANASLVDSRRATLNMMQDAVAARKKTEEANTELQREATERKRKVEELNAANDELTRFNNAAVARELRMIALKKEINGLCGQAGLPSRYPLEFEKEQE
ncbi:MAG: HAMP domain-containing protein [Nitrospirae bacterium]|nr:HAMP domain-containing protein [Nitrospirota bacterium]